MNYNPDLPPTHHAHHVYVRCVSLFVFNVETSIKIAYLFEETTEKRERERERRTERKQVKARGDG